MLIKEQTIVYLITNLARQLKEIIETSGQAQRPSYIVLGEALPLTILLLF